MVNVCVGYNRKSGYVIQDIQTKRYSIIAAISDNCYEVIIMINSVNSIGKVFSKFIKKQNQ